MRSNLATPERSARNGSQELGGRGRGTELEPSGNERPNELAVRSSDGLEIALLWYPADDRVVVSVYDTRSGDLFEVPAPRERALEVFYHPYAYAAQHGIDLEPIPVGRGVRETPGDQAAGELEQGAVVLGLLRPADEQAAEAVEPGVGALDDPAACAEAGLAARAPASPRRGSGCAA